MSAVGELNPSSQPALSDAPLATEHSALYVWYVISLLCVVNVFSYMDRMALAVLAPLIKAELQLSDGQLGLLSGVAFSLFYAIFAIPIARMADRGVRRDIIAMSLAVWSVMTALSGLAQNFWLLFLARVGIGVGEAGCLPPAQSVICDYVPLRRRSGAFAIHTLGNHAGVMIGMSLAGWLGQAIGWRWTFVVLGAPGLVLALIVRLSLREPIRGTFDAVKCEPSRQSLGGVVRVLGQCRTYRLLMYFLIVNGFAQYGLNQWLPSFYVRLYGVDVTTVGFALGTALGMGFGCGMLIGGAIANMAAQRDIRLPLMIGAAATLVAMPLAVGSLFVSTFVASIVLVALAALFWGVSNGPVIASLYSVVAPQLRATAGAITIVFISILGLALGPSLVGVLSDILMPSQGTQALRYALLAPIALFPVMIITLYQAAGALGTDLEKVGAQMEVSS